jgi:hypothetical protein
MGWIALVGAGLSAFGQYKTGQDAAAVYDYNQQLAKYQKDYVKDRADIEVAALEKDVGKFISRRRAITGKSGTVSDSGSNLDVLRETQSEADFDAALIRYNAEIEAWSAGNQADLLGTQSSQIKTGSYINTGSTILGGLSKWDWRRSSLKPRSTGYRVPVNSGYTPSY